MSRAPLERSRLWPQLRCDVGKARPARERFDEKWVERPDGCHEWTAARTRDGYGSFGPGGRPGMVLAHRWIYGQVHGELPRVVRHTCDRPWCVNVEHLVGGTQRDNVRDAIERSRHPRWRKMLTDDEIAVVRARYRGEYGDIAQLAQEFGVSRSQLHAVVEGLPRHRSLTPDVVAAIRSEYRGEYGDVVRLAAKYGASRKLVFKAVRDLPRSGRLLR